jgi:SDR family mycofactocin-dependent oxidoreductase
MPTETPRRFEGKVVFITGAARGQGRAEAVRFAAEGADIIALDICADLPTTAYPGSSPADLAETARLVEQYDRRIVTSITDVRDYDGVRAAVERGVAELGRLDVVVANAGMTTAARAWEIPLENWDATIGICLTGAYYTARAAIPILIDQGAGGAIVFTSSVAGLVGLPLLADYVAAKHGVTGLAKTLANELAKYRIRVNSVHPHGVNTDLKPGLRERLDGDPELGPLFQASLPDPVSEPEDIAAAVVWLASDEARHITGIQLPVDLGRTNRLRNHRSLFGATSPRRDQRREGEIELAGADGRDVRVDLGFIGQPGGDQLGPDLPHRRDLEPVADRPANRETARRGDVDQAGLAQRPRQGPAVAQIGAAACHQLPEGAPQPVGPPLRRAAFVEAHQRLQLGVRILDQKPAARPQRRRHRCQRSSAVGHVDEDEPGVHQVKRPRRRIRGDVVPAHLVGPIRVQPRWIDVRRQYVPGRSDGRGERLGDAAASGPHLPAAPSRPHPQAVEVPARHAVEQLGQRDEPLARLGLRVVEEVAVIRSRVHGYILTPHRAAGTAT